MAKLPSDFDEFMAKALSKSFQNLHRDTREQMLTDYRKQVHGNAFDKLDWSLWQHQNSTVSKGSCMVRVAALKLEDVPIETIRKTLLEDTQAQAVGLNERYKSVETHKPITSPMVSNMVKSAIKSVDKSYLEAFELDAKLSKEWLRRWLKKDNITVYRGIQGEPAKAMALKAQGGGETISISGNSLAGFTTQKDYASQFNGVIITKTIPINRIAYVFDWKEGNIPTPKYEHGEHEVLLSSKLVNPLTVSDIQVNEHKLGIINYKPPSNKCDIAISGKMSKALVIENRPVGKTNEPQVVISEFQDNRSPHAIAIDRGLNAKEIVSMQNKLGVKKWRQHKNKMDVRGIDTRTSRKIERGYIITPTGKKIRQKRGSII